MRLRITAALASVVVASSLVGAAGELDLTVLEHGVPPTLVAGARLQVPVRLRNDGTATWDPQDGWAVASHWRDASGRTVQWDGARTRLPGPVAAGQEVEVDALLEVPGSAGDYLLQWDLVQEGVRWLSEADPTPPPLIPVAVRVGYAFTVVEGGRTIWLRPGAVLTRRLVVRNDGSLTWPTGAGFALSYHWFARDGRVVTWDGVRSALPGPVAPGAAAVVEARLETPPRPGLYRLQWDMVEEGVTWFDARDPSPEPRRLMLVCAPPAVSPAALAVGSLAAALLAALVVRRGRPQWLLGWVAVADLPWVAVSLVVIQGAVLAGAGQTPTWSGRLLTWAGAAVLLLPLSLLGRRRRAWASWGVVAAATAVLFADAVYARFFGDVLSVAVVSAAGQLGQVEASVLGLLRPGDLWPWLNLIAGVPLVLAVRSSPRPPGRRIRLALAMATVVTVAGGAAAGARLATDGGGVLRQVFRNLYLARDLGVLNYHAYDVGREAVRALARRQLTAAELDDAVGWFAARAGRRAGAGSAFGAAAGNNLLMIQVESLQGFVVSLEVNGHKVMPFLDRWARQGLLFDDVTDQTAQGRSSDSELTTQVSVLPPAHGVAAFRYPGNHFTGIAGILADRGYHTLSAVPFAGSFWNRRLTHRAFGYATSLFARDFAPGPTIGWGLNDRAFFAQMVPRLANLPEPFCAWLITLSLHHPFAGFPDRYKILDLGGWEGTPFGNYLHTMSFFDRALEDLMTALARTGLDRRTVVVVWGDHDAGLEWDQALARITGESFDAAGWYLSQRVPLVVRVPGQPELAGVRRTAAGHQDVAPTVLALLGVDPEAYAFIGRNLLGDPGVVPVVGEYGCWQDGERLYLRRGPLLSDGECYGLQPFEPLPTDACADGFADAERQAEISRLLLEHDAQERLHVELEHRLEGAP